MGNATDEVKDAAHRVAPTNDEGGLAWAIQNVVLGT
jgi:hydroxymethylpyrimidine pyrophosphatase-like HAD family hydrolase